MLVCLYPNPPGPGARDTGKDTDKEATHTDRQYWTREQVRDEERGGRYEGVEYSSS